MNIVRLDTIPWEDRMNVDNWPSKVGTYYNNDETELCIRLIEFTRPMVHLAALQSGRTVHTAKVAAIDTSMLAAETAIQIHGGMGYTCEVDLHMFMKRAWALCGEWGDRNYHMKRLEEIILDGEAILGPGTTFR